MAFDSRSSGPEGTRTPYLYNANVALYQMSYRPSVKSKATLQALFVVDEFRP